MYVLLPPSETKHPGGNGPALDLAQLSFPELQPIRSRLITAARLLSADLPAARSALKVSAGLDHEIRLNATVMTAPTMAALDRYTGVLYAALHMGTLTRAESARAAQRILISSAMFGLIRAGDAIPAYRLSAGSRLPGLPTIAALWRESMTAALAGLDAPVLDLRSGAYAAFGHPPGAISVRVVTVTRRGDEKPVSHDNKAIKGQLARVISTTRANVADVAGLLGAARRAGLTVRRTGPASIDLIAPTAT